MQTNGETFRYAQKNYVPTAFGGSPTIPRFDDLASAQHFLDSITSPDNAKVSLESNCYSASSSPVFGTIYSQSSHGSCKSHDSGSFRSRGSASPY
jgi:hypothetical protein